jgi:hypothetical protein
VCDGDGRIIRVVSLTDIIAAFVSVLPVRLLWAYLHRSLCQSILIDSVFDFNHFKKYLKIVTQRRFELNALEAPVKAKAYSHRLP